MKFDHHMHTKDIRPTARSTRWLLIERAREIGLDGLVITEHDYQWEADELAELAATGRPAPRVFRGRNLGARGALPGLRPSLARRSARRASRSPSCSRPSGAIRPPSWPRTRFGGTSRSTRSSPSMARSSTHSSW